MAVRIADYYDHFRLRSLGFLIASQIFIFALFVALLWFLNDYLRVDLSNAVSACIALFTSIEVIVMTLTFKAITEPIRIMNQAISHVSNQASDLPAPYINKPQYEKNGLKALVQTIYDLALKGTPDLVVKTADTTTMNSDSAMAILNAMPVGIIGLDTDGKVAFANKNAPIRIDTSQKQEIELLFSKDESLTHWLTASQIEKLRDTHTWSRVPNKLPDEADRKLFDVIAEYEKGSASGFETLIITIDRTSHYATAEEDMDFIALAAHELRGPVTVIRGYLDVINEELADVLKPDQHELIDRLSVSANRLSGYINNILNVSRFDRRHLKLHLHEDKLAEIVDSLKPDLDMRARTQNRILTYNLPTDLPTIAADRNSLSEVISNLVDNAIKYSNDGGQIIVTATVKGDFVEMSVQDFGMGIPASVVSGLFAKFYRSHLSRQTVSGTGLGLYICKAIIESHGGQIWVRSTEGQGSIFGFSVPVYATVADKLLASDNDNQDIIQSAHGWIKNHSMMRK
ncbi:MAG TPA: HAMP domain-containing sensor histidine kinase [Candidatus Saccharimonadales bacterium]|nr:HAMP domain-containing sensor histidine kinase [Candidatus Saccharimonadales bacterium]